MTFDKSVALAVAIGALTLAFAWAKYKTKNMAEPNPPLQAEPTEEEESNDNEFESVSENSIPPFDSEEGEDENTELSVTSTNLGCKHYRRACQKQCPNPICAGKYWPCRLCHDEEMYDACLDPKKNHQFERKAVTHVKCMRCQTEQPKCKTCTKCKEDFAKYFCGTCSLYDDLGDQKKIFHCEKCTICRVGGREQTYHCDTCECCLNIAMKDNHKCVNNRLKQDCPICLEELHDSRLSATFLRCGHSMHSKCYQGYVKT